MNLTVWETANPTKLRKQYARDLYQRGDKWCQVTFVVARSFATIERAHCCFSSFRCTYIVASPAICLTFLNGSSLRRCQIANYSTPCSVYITRTYTCSLSEPRISSSAWPSFAIPTSFLIGRAKSTLSQS